MNAVAIEDRIVLEIGPELGEILSFLEKRLGQSRAEIVRRIVLDGIEDLEDIELARDALAEGGKPVPLDVVMKRFGLDR
jgi:predicted DNA-binding protein